jgi:UDP-glucose 4-epimerase
MSMKRKEREVDDSLRESTILIVGGAGFVGSNLAKLLLAHDVKRLHIIDNLLSSEKFNIPDNGRITFIEGSITDDRILGSLADDYEYIFHLATYHGNQSSIHNPLADHENNTLTTLKLYETIKGFKKLKKVVYSSAGCSVAEKTFDKAEASTEIEHVSLKMDSPYSISKIIGEFYSNYYFKQHGLPAVRARFQNVYGPGEVLGAGQWRGTPASVWRNVTPTFIFKALKKKTLPVENEGIATRDFIYVEDVARGLLACALRGKAGEPYNIASGEETSILALAEGINVLASNPTPITFLPKRAWDNSGKRYGSIAKSSEQLGFKAEVDINEGLRRTMEWTIHHLNRIEETMRKHKAHYDYEKE